MTNQKHQESEDNDPGKSPTSAVNESGIDNIDSTDSSEENNDSELLFRTLSQLQTVRVPGKGKLKLNEALSAAISQGDVFSRWCARGTPVGEIEVWVEERRVMSVLPLSPAELQEFTFKVPSPDTAVLQLTTSADGEKAVLYNLRLRDVPPKGLNHTEAWPNGQSMSLNITCRLFAVAGASSSNSRLSGSGRLEEFCIRIAINSQRVASASPTPIDGPTAEPTTTVTGEDCSATDDKPKAMAARAASSTAARFGAVAGLLILCSLLIGGFRDSWALPCEPHERAWGMTPAGLSLYEPVQQGDGTTALSVVELTNPTSDRLARSPSRSGVAVNLSPTVPKSRGLAPGSKIDRKGSSAVATHHTVPNDAGKVARVGFDHTALSPWQISVFPKLAALKNVHIKLDYAGAEPARTENLRVSFVRLWEASERFKVLSDTDQSPADGVISLRFEPAEPCLGLVYLKVNGPDGRALWQDVAWESPQTCRNFPNAGQNELFSDASVVLVERLKTTIRLAQESAKRTETLVTSD